MASRKRKSPKGQKGRQQPGFTLTAAGAVGSLGLRGLSALASVAGRHPSVSGGTLCFFVVFSFVAANALWYQRGAHPHPLFKTRDLSSARLFGFNANRLDQPGRVTTFRIERQDDAAASDPARSSALPSQSTGQVPAPNSLVLDIQKELIRRGLYNGVADGVTGPRTSAAILFFEQTVGMPEKGEASAEVLAALRTDAIGASALPVARPQEPVASLADAPDPVAAAILGAERQMRSTGTTQTIAARPVAQQAKAVPVKETKNAGSPVAAVDLVLKIQKGLSNMAYSNVSIDGVVGDSTREAIKRFQKHYNLPQTGEPNEAVLKKLKDIGAL